MSSNDRYDVAIMGGGLAGLTLALQLAQARPGIRVLVLERTAHPVPEAAHKVGEATVENSAHYFADVLGLREYLQRRHLRKMGLRFFPTAAVPRALTDRLEVGSRNFLARETFQLDRGRFENDLASIVRDVGVDLRHATRVADFTLDADGEHRVTCVDREDVAWTPSARWLVDASGRRALVKRRLGLERQVAHDINAAWLRLADPISLDDLPEEDGVGGEDLAEWRGRVPSGQRWRSTNHLMGRGYWAWLIPLGSGSTSVGLVADPDCVPFDRFNRIERLEKWLGENEPELAAALARRRSSLQDFRMMRGIPYGAERVYSRDRWCLTGEAGVFLDPLYSPGSDFIGLSNTFITDFVLRDLAGEDVGDRVERANTAYLDGFAAALPVWEHQYPLMGNPRVYAIKAAWDTLAYFGVLNVLFVNDRLADLDFMDTVHDEVSQHRDVNHGMQRAFREWDRLGNASDPASGGFVDLSAPVFARLNAELDERLDAEQVRNRLARNVAFLEDLARELADLALDDLGRPSGAKELTALSRRPPGTPPATRPPADTSAVARELFVVHDGAPAGAR